ncbi:hypothetical protein BG006_009385 [Podila minutissima]|uniref:Fn3-like domain-containing protein n=1 Tax=Podila minutissima TaxID=64525 RepID=A0A9P5SEG3_9FUNG|nr:hypothetical protein BG006_009385 [Podila minutissima]
MLVQTTPFGLAGLTGTAGFPLAAIEFAAGEELLAVVKKTPATTFAWSTEEKNFKVEGGGAPSGFSSWGLPISVLPSGTSMATPYTAGAHALLYNAHKKILKPVEARRILKATATPGFDYKHTTPASVAKQGAGLINIKNAIAVKTIISPEHIQLLDTNNFAGKSIQVKIKNTGKKTATYVLSHEAAESVVSYRGGNTFPLLAPIIEKDAAKVTFSTTKVTIKAGQVAKVKVHFTEPATGKADEFPIYSGYIVATPNGKGSIPVRVPYAGLKGDLSKVPIQDADEGFPSLQVTDIKTGKSSFPAKGKKINWTAESAFLATRLGSHTPDLRLVLVDAEGKHVGFLNTQYGAASFGSWGRNHYVDSRTGIIDYRTWRWIGGLVFPTADAVAPITPAAGAYKVQVASQRKFTKGAFPADFEIYTVAEITV